MSEIEKMKRYIERTKMDESLDAPYSINLEEAKDWFPRMCEYGFSEGQDFCSILSESTGGRPAQDAVLSIFRQYVFGQLKTEK